MRGQVRIVNRFPLELRSGGQQTVTILANFLRLRGFEVDVITDTESTYHPNLGPDETARSLAEVPYRKIRFTRPKSPLRRWAYGSEVPIEWLLKEGVNLVFLDKCPSPSLLAAINDANVKVLFLLHGVAIDSMRPFLRPYAVYAEFYDAVTQMLFWLTRAPLQHPGIEFEVLNPSASNFLEKIGVPPHRIHLIPTAFFADDYFPLRDDSTFSIVYVGRLERMPKGVDFLRDVILSSLSSLPDNTRWVVIGSGRDASVVGDIAPDPRIEILGFVDETRKKRALSEANLMVITSYLEPYALTVIEGLSSGLPVISTPVSGPEFLLSMDDSFGVVAGFTTRSFVEAIRRKYFEWRNNPEAYFRRKVVRKSIAARRFRVDQMLAGYERVVTAMFEAKDPGNRKSASHSSA